MIIDEIIQRDILNNRLSHYSAVFNSKSVVNSVEVFDINNVKACKPEVLYILGIENIPSHLPSEKTYNFIISSSLPITKEMIPERLLLNCNILTTTIPERELYLDLNLMFLDDSIINSHVKKMMEERLKNGIASMVQSCADSINADIMVLDQSEKVLERAKSKRAHEETESYRRFFNQEYIKQQKDSLVPQDYKDFFVKNVMKNEGLESYWDEEINKYIVILNIKVNRVAIGRISVFTDGQVFSVPEIEILCSFSRIMSNELYNSNKYTISYRQNYENFLVKLLSGLYISEDSVRNEMKNLNHDFMGKCCVIALCVMYPEEKDSDSIDRQLRTMETKSRSMFKEEFTTKYEDGIAIIINLKPSEEISDKYINYLREIVNNDEVLIGVSKCSQNISKVSELYSQAREVAALGFRYRKKKLSYFTETEKLYVLKVLDENMDLLSLVDDKIMKLYEMDCKENGKGYFYTLYYYLLYNGNSYAVSKKMNMHRNTVFYRIDKIKQELDINLEDGEKNMRYLFSFDILNYFEMIHI